MLSLIFVVVLAFIIFSCFKARHCVAWGVIILLIVTLLEMACFVGWRVKKSCIAQIPKVEEQGEIIQEQMDNLKKGYLETKEVTEEELDQFLKRYQYLQMQCQENENKMKEYKNAPRHIEVLEFLLFLK